MWYEAWCKAVESARGGLTATLIIQHPNSGRLYVNFDPEILQLIRYLIPSVQHDILYHVAKMV